MKRLPTETLPRPGLCLMIQHKRLLHVPTRLPLQLLRNTNFSRASTFLQNLATIISHAMFAFSSSTPSFTQRRRSDSRVGYQHPR